MPEIALFIQANQSALSLGAVGVLAIMICWTLDKLRP
jgi:hypothetical protein